MGAVFKSTICHFYSGLLTDWWLLPVY